MYIGFVPFAILKVVFPRDKTGYIFVIYIFVAFVFQFVDTALGLNGIAHDWLYNIYTPIEIFFFAYILLTIFPLTTINEETASLIISLVLCLIAYGVVFFSSINNLDYSTTFIEDIMILILGGRALAKIDYLDHKLFIVIGTLSYGILNTFTYPKYHLESNIVMNICFIISLVIMWLKPMQPMLDS